MSRVTGVGIGLAGLIVVGLSTAPAVGGAGRAGTDDRKEERSAFRLFDGGGRLGVRLDDVDKEDVGRLKLAEERGALVRDVEAGSPAARAGLEEGDVVLRYQGETVQSAAQLARMVRETPAGRSVTLEVSRGGAAQRLSATLGEADHFRFGGDLGELHVPPIAALPELPKLDAERWGRAERLLLRDPWRERGPRRLGLEYQEISGQLASYFRLEADEGLLVTSVDADGPAGRAGIKAGDVILKLNGKAVRDGAALREELQHTQPGQEAMVTVQREGKLLDLKVTLGGRERRRTEDETA
jgi:predicted metalloprotease with PDZ domain